MQLIDTDVLIDVQRGFGAAADWFATDPEVGVPGFVVMELVQDARNSDEVQKALALVDGLEVVWPSGAECQDRSWACAAEQTDRHPAAAHRRRFTLVAAMNPCPCGYFGTDRCRCKPADVKKYQSKISGPISDRIDLQVTLKPLTTDERFAPTEDDVSPMLRAQVEAARQRQAKRFQGTGIAMNAAIPGGAVMDYCKLSPAALEHYKATIDANTLSTRSMDRLAKVARTAADLTESDTAEPEHIDAAARFVIGGTLRENF